MAVLKSIHIDLSSKKLYYIDGTAVYTCPSGYSASPEC